MGRFNKKGGRRGNKFGRGGDKNKNFTGGDRESWKEIEKENSKWEAYYKAQNIIPDAEEFEIFKKHCQDHLPLTFRITGSRKHADEIRTLFKEKHLPNLTKIDSIENYSPPRPMPWYPEELGWQIDLPKSVIKKNEEYAKTQRFLVLETEVGNISRQEAVSMIPPLVMDIKPHHYVLDMCAAPGSKTAQLVEALHANDDGDLPTGFVIANDSDYKRSHMLVHQIKRLNSANFIVVNHDAQLFPKIKLEANDYNFIKFDRILCDVPCSGDGTMRKNINVWQKWGIGNALGLHPLQVNILNRGLQLLKKGGRLVYSTCSLSPIENEAVVAAALRKWGDQIRLVNCDNELPNLIRKKGLNDWVVFDKSATIKTREDNDENIPETCFPPSQEEISKFNLENCIRVYPHLQNTGGFFITVFEKIDNNKRDIEEATNGDSQNNDNKKLKTDTLEKKDIAPPSSTTQKKERLPRDANEEPFVFLDANHPELQKCWDFYDITDDFPKDCTIVRNASGEPIRSIYFVSSIIKDIIKNNELKLKIVHSGVKLFVSQKSEYSKEVCQWRVQNEGLFVIKKFLSPSRQVSCSLDILVVLLKEAFPNLSKLKENYPDDEFFEKINGISEGCCFINIKRGEHEEDLFLPLWKGKNNVNLMVNKQETYELMYRIFGIETEKNAEYKQKPNNVPSTNVEAKEKSENSETTEISVEPEES
ncbi:hypothetical protein PACTADRAFT_43494 [Pachysolen tannophilus NRRL Y-2460]|uniref:SAM-dependent MTase RsmB/NOP-type domain-containing protein n=1 Tax=Pachysolen tannophilus NRRL Y-2460 TaxID=669874 RepID=A0A1E4TTE5_PACTA|nr:hypothetical protein PACTADRAFT_43494 [Pachysolen tannophilus NRRL Y-2460]